MVRLWKAASFLNFCFLFRFLNCKFQTVTTVGNSVGNLLVLYFSGDMGAGLAFLEW